MDRKIRRYSNVETDSESLKYLEEIQDAITDCLRPYSGYEVNEELVGDLCDALYNGIKSTGLEVNVAGYEEHIDVKITHPLGSDAFEANIRLDIKGTLTDKEVILDGNNREAIT